MWRFAHRHIAGACCVLALRWRARRLMTSSLTNPSGVRKRLATAATAMAIAACGNVSAHPAAPSPAGVTGALRFLEGPDTAIGPAVVVLEPIDSTLQRVRPTRMFTVRSSTDRFDPPISAIADGDYIVFANDGGVSHRFFSADLEGELQIPVGPGESSEPQRIDYLGELRFFCSLHPDEHFSLLVTDAESFGVVDPNGRYYVGPVAAGTYRLSIWSPKVRGPIRTVNVEWGHTLEVDIWLDPDLIGR